MNPTTKTSQSNITHIGQFPLRAILLFYLLLFFPLSIYADGPTTIHGVNSFGEHIAIDEEWLPDPKNPNSGMNPTGLFVVSITAAGKPAQELGGQHFEFKESGNISGFSSTDLNKSPLAGARYQFVKDLPNCRGSLFACKAGCGSRTPTTMTKNYWECPTLGADYYDACDPNNHEAYGVLASNNVNLRERPELTAPVLKRLGKDKRVKILQRRQECLTINYEMGQWIKVQVSKDTSPKSGWIFDASVEYTDK